MFLNKCCRWFYMLFVFEHLKRCQISYLFVDVICLGVLKNGAKYHFCLRKSTGDMSKVISSLASRFLNFRTACISTPLLLPCADIDHFCMRKRTGDMSEVLQINGNKRQLSACIDLPAHN